MLVGKLFYILTIVFILIISLVIIFDFGKGHPQFDKISDKIPIATAILLGVGILVSGIVFDNDRQKAIIETTSNANDRIFINFFKLWNDTYDKCPNFMNNLMFKFQSSENIYKTNKEDNQVSVEYFSNVIFSNIDRYLTSCKLTNTSDAAYIRFFLSLMHSKDIQKIWDKYSYMYTDNVKLFINELIRINNVYKFSSSEELIDFSKKYITTKEFKMLW